jgi:hypothetical protein
VIIRRKKERTTVTADLKTNTVPVGTTTTIEITGKIQTSLYVALEEKLNAAVAQRISWLLQSRDVPLTTLPKGSTFSVRIEQITGPMVRRCALAPSKTYNSMPGTKATSQ